MKKSRLRTTFRKIFGKSDGHKETTDVYPKIGSGDSEKDKPNFYPKIGSGDGEKDKPNFDPITGSGDGEKDKPNLDPNLHILTNNFSDEQGHKYWAKFSTKHFDSGASRFAFKGTFRGSGPKKDKGCVVKVFKDDYAENIDSWVPDLYASIRAKEMAKEFSEEVLPLLVLKEGEIEFDFVLPSFAKVDESTMTESEGDLRKNLQIAKQEYVAIEEFIEGDYVKFNSNGGWEAEGLSDIMPAFTHWTWERTCRTIMVCDLQGVKKKVGRKTIYTLTDPAIHSIDETFGMTDLGAAGMYKVLSHHKCTDICRQLNLEVSLQELVKFMILREIFKTGTTYKFELTEDEKRWNAMEKR